MILRRSVLALVVILLLLPSLASAQSAIAHKPSVSSLWDDAAVLRDTAGRLTLDDVRRSGRFRPATMLQPDVRSNALRPSVLWFRFRMPPTGGEQWYLRLSQQVLYADIYAVARNGAVRQNRSGMLVPAGQRAIRTADVIGRIPSEAAPRDPIFVRVVTPIDRFPEFELLSQTRLLQRETSCEAGRLIALSLSVGSILALGLLAAVVAFVVRNPIFVWYASTMFALALYELVASGLAWRLLWPQGSVPYDPLLYVSYLGYLALVIAFSGTLLGIRFVAPGFWRLVRASYAVAFLCATFTVVWPNLLATWHASAWLAPLAVTVCLGTVLAAGISVWAGVRDRLSQLFCLAFAGGIVGLVTDLCARTGLLPENVWTVSAAGIGAAVQAVFLAVAIAERALGSAARVEMLQEERDDLEAVALRDALTGVWNRRAFEERLADEWQRCTRSRMNLAIVLLDVDHFKAYNDACGHPSGDRVLAIVARRMAHALRRPYDLIARYGGEEFVLLLPGCGLEDAKRIGENARHSVHSAMIPHPGSEYGMVTVSVGVAGMIPTPDQKAETLIATADQALYAAKRDGRDRVVVAGAA